MTAALLEPVASVDGIALHAPGESLDPQSLRQRACLVLLQQAARRAGLLAADEPAPVDGIAGPATDQAIDALLDQALRLPDPDEAACRRWYASHEATFRQGDALRARHVLFAVTPGVDVAALRAKAEATLLALRTVAASAGRSADRVVEGPTASVSFARVAAECSNCPSAAAGGELGWITRDDVAPEIARELFGGREVGVLPRLVHSRFGLHVFEVHERRDGVLPGFDAVRQAVEAALRRQSFGAALAQYLRRLAAEAEVVGVDIEGAAGPLLR